MIGLGAGVTLRVWLSVPVQPLDAVAVTAYVPDVPTVIVGVLCPVLQLYATKPVVVLNVAVPPEQIVLGPAMTGVGTSNSATVKLSVAVQPKLSVAVTVKMPPVMTLMFAPFWPLLQA